MTGVEVDLDRPPEFGDGEIEPDVAVAGKLDAVLANESAYPGVAQGVGDPDLGM
jgi:hypothetical protein